MMRNYVYSLYQLNHTSDFHFHIGLIQIKHAPFPGFGSILIKYMHIFYDVQEGLLHKPHLPNKPDGCNIRHQRVNVHFFFHLQSKFSSRGAGKNKYDPLPPPSLWCFKLRFCTEAPDYKEMLTRYLIKTYSFNTYFLGSHRLVPGYC